MTKLIMILSYIINVLGIPTFIVFAVLKAQNMIDWNLIWVCLPLIVWIVNLTSTIIAFCKYAKEDDDDENIE